MKQRFLVVVLSLVAVGFAFANGSGEDAATVFEIASNSTEDQQIQTQQEVFQTIIDEYNAANGTAYTLNFVSGQSMDIMNTRMSSSDRPDLFMIDSPADVQEYAKDGLLLDLTAYAERDAWQDKVFDWAYSLAQVDGQVVTLPYGYEGMVLWYNKEIMAELGLNGEEIDTLAEYEDALRRAQEAGYIPVMLGSQNWPWAQEWYLSILYSYTGRETLKAIIEGKEGAGWNTPEFAQVVEMYKSWHDQKFLADGRSYILTSDDAINAFTSGRALFKTEGTWASYWITPLTLEQQANIGVILHPAIDTAEEPHMPLAVGGMWCVSADTDKADLAGYVLNRLLSSEFQDEFMEAGLDIAPIALGEETFAGATPTMQRMWQMVNGALADGNFGYATWAFYPPQTRVYLYEGIVEVMEGNISVEDYLAEMDRLTQQELSEGFVPVLPAVR